MVWSVELVVYGRFGDGPVLAHVGRSLVHGRRIRSFAGLDHGPWSSSRGAVVPRGRQTGCNGVIGMVEELGVGGPRGSSTNGTVQGWMGYMVCVQQDRLRLGMRWLWDWGQLLGMIRVWWVYRVCGGLLARLSRNGKRMERAQEPWCGLTDDRRK